MNKETDKNKYWKDVEDKSFKPIAGKEEYTEQLFDQFKEVTKNRRSFLKLMGFSISALPLTSCIRIPVRKALPYLHKNDMNVPGVAAWYASTCNGCEANCAILVKNREGRPIKIEGNPLSPVSKGGLCAVGQATLLDLYDSYRLTAPRIQGKESDWVNFDTELNTKLETMSASGKEITLVTPPLRSPSSMKVIEEFKKIKGVTHITYSANSVDALARAHQEVFGVLNYPSYDLNQVDYLVSIGADFLGTWLAPVAFTKDYANRKDLTTGRAPLKHVQIETIMTLSGSNADERVVVSVNEQREVLVQILALVQQASGAAVVSNVRLQNEAGTMIARKVTAELLAHKGKSLLLCGLNDVSAQVVVATINELLTNYGKGLSIIETPYFISSSDLDFEELIGRMEKGAIEGVLFAEVNPLYSYPDSTKLKTALSKVPFKLTFANHPDETSEECTHIAPANHFLESWNDHYKVGGHFTLTQPALSPLYGSRIWQESLLRFMNNPAEYYDFIKTNWNADVFPKQKVVLTADAFFEKSIQDGYVNVPMNEKSGKFNQAPVATHVNRLLSFKKVDGTLLYTYEKVSQRDGRHANNPWLHELPDPITKVAWDNYLQISPDMGKSMGIKTGDLLSFSAGNLKYEVTALVQPGLHESTVALAVGYGHKIGGKVAKDLGVNAYPFRKFENGTIWPGSFAVTITKVGRTKDLAMTQTHHSLEGRDMVRETTYEEFKKNPKAGNEKNVHLISMWDEHKKGDHKWAMMIDLNKCTGCSGCIVSCNAENNVPVVGKQEVINRREMHWLRIDRYYKGDDKNPQVVHQPVMCHHCENAPCETVCPVLATVHSSDGLNQQVYNRCIGTRYCANNCPYKVRRFNWFNYPHTDASERMALNPDVVVRNRGVMEKCSMCVQRIQEGKLVAKKEGRDLLDGEIKTACQQSCPADAIVFGDIQDVNSAVSKLLRNERNYRMLEELNIKPAVSYLTKVRS